MYTSEPVTSQGIQGGGSTSAQSNTLQASGSGSPIIGLLIGAILAVAALVLMIKWAIIPKTVKQSGDPVLIKKEKTKAVLAMVFGFGAFIIWSIIGVVVYIIVLFLFARSNYGLANIVGASILLFEIIMFIAGPIVGIFAAVKMSKLGKLSNPTQPVERMPQANPAAYQQQVSTPIPAVQPAQQPTYSAEPPNQAPRQSVPPTTGNQDDKFNPPQGGTPQ